MPYDNTNPFSSYMSLFGSPVPQQTTYQPPVATTPSVAAPASIYGGGQNGGLNLSSLLGMFSGGQGGMIGRPGRQLNINGVESPSNLTSNDDWAKMFNNTGVLGGKMQSSVQPGMNPGMALQMQQQAARNPPLASTLFNMATNRPSQTNPTYMF